QADCQPNPKRSDIRPETAEDILRSQHRYWLVQISSLPRRDRQQPYHQISRRPLQGLSPIYWLGASFGAREGDPLVTHVVLLAALAPPVILIPFTVVPVTPVGPTLPIPWFHRHLAIPSRRGNTSCVSFSAILHSEISVRSIRCSMR